MNLKGGKLCNFQNMEGDIYTKGSLLDPKFKHIWLDENNENIIIKKIKSEEECEMTKMMADEFDFVPKYYGCFTCNDIERRPKYKKPNEYDERNVKNIYLVIQRLNATSLDDSKYSIDKKIELLETYMSQIYEKYLLLCDKGIIWRDLYCRNILVDDEGKIYFIDFDFEFSEIMEGSIPKEQRYTEEQLHEDLIRDLYESNGGRRRKNKNKTRKNKSRKNKSRKNKNKNKNKSRTRKYKK